jgi:hypothetical protein
MRALGGETPRKTLVSKKEHSRNEEAVGTHSKDWPEVGRLAV